MEERRQLVYLKLTEIVPYENNPRKNDPAVDKVAASLRAFGAQAPIVVDEDYVIIAGHTRWKAAKKVGMTEFPCVIADNLDEEQVRAYRLADNKTGEFAEWDDDKLDEELAQILNIDMGSFGFDLSTEDENHYSMATNVPQYEPTGAEPELPQLVDTERADSLIEEIKASGVSDEQKEFLIQAARRHNVFNYKNIAEYYANADKEMQELMERSALVIIDIDDAMKYGYCDMIEEIKELIGGEDEDDE